MQVQVCWDAPTKWSYHVELGESWGGPFIPGVPRGLAICVALEFMVVLGGHSGCRHAMAHPLNEAAHTGIEVLFVFVHCFCVWGTSLFR